MLFPFNKKQNQKHTYVCIIYISNLNLSHNTTFIFLSRLSIFSTYFSFPLIFLLSLLLASSSFMFYQSLELRFKPLNTHACEMVRFYPDQFTSFSLHIFILGPLMIGYCFVMMQTTFDFKKDWFFFCVHDSIF